MFLMELLEKLNFAPGFHLWFSVFLLPCAALCLDQLDFQLPLRIAGIQWPQPMVSFQNPAYS